MSKDKKFWGNLSNSYNRMFENRKPYKKMYDLMREALNKDMKVLEIGTASGLVARAVSNKVKEVYAIDFSKEIIKKAKEISKEKNIYFSVGDSNSLEFKDKSFDAVIIANVLHIIKNPENTLKEINRVLKDDGILIAATYVWKEISLLGKFQKFIMMRKGFPIYSEWSTKEYLDFLKQNDFTCTKQETIQWSFNICYAECKKYKGKDFYKKTKNKIK